MRYDVVLIDIDDTLFDFRQSSFEALERAFARRDVSFTWEDMPAYEVYNDRLWRAFERGEIRAAEDDESENDLHVKWLAAQYAIEAVMADPRIERQTKEIYELLLEHAQNGRHGDGAFEAIAARFKVSPASVYKHRQRMEERLQKYYKAFLDAREVR